MNGKLTSTQNENVIYLAENDKLITFEVRNTDTTTNKIFNIIPITKQEENCSNRIMKESKKS